MPERVNSIATVGTEPGGTRRYSMDGNPLTYASFPHTYRPPKMTENHGVPGSNPGPATSKNPANSGKMKYPGDVPGALYRRRVNSRIKIRPLPGRLSQSPACLLRRGCRWRGSS